MLWSLVGITLSQLELLSTGWFYGAFDWVFIKITNIFGSVLILGLTWFLFPSIVTLIITFFLEHVIKAVERKHYPNSPQQRQQNTWDVVRITIKFMLLSGSLNVLVIPFYAVFFWLGPVNLLIFYMFLLTFLKKKHVINQLILVLFFFEFLGKKYNYYSIT